MVKDQLCSVAEGEEELNQIRLSMFSIATDPFNAN